jgi:hypothetical protein
MPTKVGEDFKQYVSTKQGRLLRSYLLGEDLTGVWVRPHDSHHLGCPKSGDWISRSRYDENDQCIVSAEEFEEEKYMPLEDVQEIRGLIASFVKVFEITHVDLLRNDLDTREEGLDLLEKLILMVGLHPEP